MMKSLKLLAYLPGFILAYIFATILDLEDGNMPKWVCNVSIVHTAFVEWYQEDTWL